MTFPIARNDDDDDNGYGVEEKVYSSAGMLVALEL